MESYLKEFYQEDITNLLNDSNDCVHVSINLNLSHLKTHRPDLYTDFLKNIRNNNCEQWDKALLEVQKQLLEGNIFLEPGFQIKENCHVRFVNLPKSEQRLKGVFPNNDHVGLFVQVKGSIVRMTQSRLLEYKREYACNRCKEIFTIEAEYEKMFVFDVPRTCPNPLGTCKGTLYPKNSHPKPEYCIDYQELRIQELFSDKNVPASLIVSLDNDLVDTCQPGECITICGTIERRWRPFSAGKRSDVIISMRALGICKDEEKVNFNKDYSEQLLCVRAQWQDSIDQMGLFPARDNIIRSICPEIHGMYMVKLAIALSLCSGVQQNNNSGSTTRGHSHLLLVGDPGLAKSKLLKAASKIALRSVHTTGMGCSAAGLTAAAIKEEGEWQLEAGALVLADGGVCCIDEFNLMRENDKASIHEAMEQQTISMAKAGLVCKLSTRCVILAATNPKNLYTMSEAEGTSALNIGIGSPLLSRFDIVLILRDERDSDWDTRVADHILKLAVLTENFQHLWDLERLQSHFLAVHEINPKISQDASTILASYYQFCRSDLNRDPARTTVRLLDSLNRLAQAHTRLTFRDKVEGIDAIVVIRLMEFTWGFGRLLKSINILKEDLPLGPNEEQICEILKLLKLERLQDIILKQSKLFSDGYHKSKVPIVEKNTEKRSLEIKHLEKQFGYNKKKLRTSNGNKENVNKNNPKINTEIVERNRKETSKRTSPETLVEQIEMHPNTDSNIRRNILEHCDNIDDIDFELDIDINSKNNQNKGLNVQEALINENRIEKIEIPKKPNSFNDLDFSDDDLNLDFDIDFNIKQQVDTIKRVEPAQINDNTTKVQTILNEVRPGPSKDVSTTTLNKLSRFRNPNYKDKTSVNVSSEEVPQKVHNEENQNSDHGTPRSSSAFAKLTGQSSSHILACQDDDLNCLEFDI